MTHQRAAALMVLATLMWSMAGVVTRHLDAARSFEVTFWRSFFNASMLTLVLVAMRGSGLWRGIARAPWPLWASGACWAVMYTAFMVAMTLTTVANVLVTMAIGPLITALFSRLFLGHRLPGRTWLAIVLASLGIAWMFGRDAASGASFAGTLIGAFVPVAAAINWTVLQFASGTSADSGSDEGIDMLPAVLIGAALSAIVTLPFAYPFQANAHDLGLLGLLGVAQLAIPCLLVVRLTRELPAPEISLLSLLEVVFGVTWAWLGADERPSSDTLIGGGLVIGALVFNELLGMGQRRRERLSTVQP
jgi:drug/metabolite transporter (DMT)-like permease